MTQNVQPKTELFRDRYRRRVRAKDLPRYEVRAGTEHKASQPVG